MSPLIIPLPNLSGDVEETVADFTNLSPNSLLLHGLHFLSPGNHAVYYLFLFICQVWTRTRAWLHGPGTPVSQTIVATLLIWLNSINTFEHMLCSSKINKCVLITPNHYSAVWLFAEQTCMMHIQWKVVYLLLFITVEQITHQREAWKMREAQVVRHTENIPHLIRFCQSCLPWMHAPLPVVGCPTIRAVAHHCVRHAALSQSAAGERQTQRCKQLKYVNRWLLLFWKTLVSVKD